MRIAFAFLVLATVGCSAGDPPTSEVEGSSAGKGSASGGTGATGSGGSAGLGTTGGSSGAGPSSGGSSSGQGSGGSSGGSGGSAGSMMKPPPDGAGVGAITQCNDRTLVGPTPIRRLSRLEYFNSVRDLFGVQVNQGDLPSDELLGNIFTANVRTRMGADQFTRYDTSAKSVATQVAANIAQLSGCGAADSACIQSYLLDKTRQAFHGSLDAADPDRQRLTDLYTAVAADDAALAVGTAVRFMLSSPRFLYSIEFGATEGNFARLTAGELSGRLASFLWRSVPDAALLAAVDDGSLVTPAGIRAQATRMVSDPKAATVLHEFANEWLGIKTVASAGPLDAAIDAEAGDVFAAAAQGTGTYPELLTSTQTRGTSELAQFYGSTLGGDGTITLPAERQGLLLRAGFLRSHIKGDRASPTQRGKQIRQALLCDPVQFPETNVNMGLPTPVEGQNDNELFGQHASNPECAGCHVLMDPIGFAFGDYGPDGKFDQSLADTTSGTIEVGNVNPLEASFADVNELINVLATNVNPQQCFVIQMNRFALGRSETLADACGLSDIWTAFQAGNQSINTLLVEVASSYLMQVRNIVKAGEACQ